MVERPVLILCGGLGTRLREETEYRPKPMVEIGGRPMLWHIMRIFAAQGASEFVLCLGYRGEMIRRYFLDYELMNADVTVELGSKRTTIHDRTSEAGWKITFVDTGDKAQTGARLARARRHVGERGCFVTYGDTLANVDLRALSEHHAREKRHVTVTAVHPWSVRFGELEVHDSRVVRFREKPEEKESYINGGFFVFEPQAFEYLSTDDDCVLEREPLERLAADDQLTAYRHDGFWACMDTYRDWMALNTMCERGERPWQSVERDRRGEPGASDELG